ncbi:MAG: tetratricopeptide repeat protein [Acidobacteriota bacterium]
MLQLRWMEWIGAGRRVPSGGLLLFCFLVLAAVPVLWGGALWGGDSKEVGETSEVMGFRVTGGAAPGYIEDRACALCHREIAKSYEAVGMARSFMTPSADNRIEDFSETPWTHEPSGRTYEMAWEEEQLIFRRWQEGEGGERVNLWEQPVNWILGSGNHARTYLAHSPGGELYQLPVAWYSQEGRWGMAPGFNRANHEGVGRRVRRECMFCHNGYPNVPAGSDAHFRGHRFPEVLPEGTGCQRCHGPGAEHVRRAMGGMGTTDALRQAIVNPARLPAARRDAVCWQCHLQPSFTMVGVRRFGRGDYSFRPGEALSDYLVSVDVVEADEPEEERFEINHHPYRLEQSRCFQESAGALSCLTCHDPHRKVPAAERAAHYRAACLSCHQDEACRLDEMTATVSHAGVDPEDCVSCHMPERRPHDVVEVVMTDHTIQRSPPPESERLATRPEGDPEVESFHLHRSAIEDSADPDRLALLGVLAAVRAGGGSAGEAVAQLESLIESKPPQAFEPYLDLMRAAVQQRRFGVAEKAFAEVSRRTAGEPAAEEWSAILRLARGDREGALAILDQAVAGNPERPEARFNRGRIRVAVGRLEEAAADFEAVAASRPNQVFAWYQLGLVRARQERPEAAVAAFQRALAVEPSHTDSYRALAETLGAMGEDAERDRWLRYGARWAKRPAELPDPDVRSESTSKEPSIDGRKGRGGNE